MSKADDLVRSITPKQLEKTRSEVHKEIESTKPECEECEDEECEDEECEENGEENEDKRIDKVDLISDVQLITVGRLQGVIRLIWATIVIILLVLAAQVLQFIRQLDLQGKIIVISESQERIAEAQKEAAEAAKENTREVAAVKKEVSETKEQVKEAVEASPKIEVDPDSGKAKVVIPVKKNDQKTDKKEPASDKPSKPPKPAPPVQPPTQVELR